MLSMALAGSLDDWTVNLDRLPETADFVARITRENYPKLDVPMHSRWRHLSGVSLQGRAAFDLVITSVLLDAGAGPGWRYQDFNTGAVVERSEGLALASLRWFELGGLSAHAADPLRADASALKHVDAAGLNLAFQVSSSNPLIGAESRASLLNRLGAAVDARPDLFALEDSPRPGGLFDEFATQAKAAGAPLRAGAILETLLEALGPIWLNRPTLGGVPLGDCWPHPALPGGYVPLHKLSQWLAYSLVEPLQDAGITITGLDELTGLPEYRNGGLLIDMGVLTPRDPAALAATHAVASPFVVGMRSLTVALLDRLAPLVAKRLGLPEDQYRLARVLEGGTWSAGRRIARERRPDGGPPFQISSDGTVL
jgi:hypothetical protein